MAQSRLSGHAVSIAMKAMAACTLLAALFCNPSWCQVGFQVKNQDQLILALEVSAVGADRDEKVNSVLRRFRTLITPLTWESIMIKAGAAYYNSSPRKALLLYEVAVAIAQHLRSEVLIARTYYKIGLTHSGMGDNEKAIQAYRLSQQIFSHSGQNRDLIYILGDLSSLYFAVQDFYNARVCAEETLSIGKASSPKQETTLVPPDEYGIAGALSTLGSLSQRDGDYPKAIEYFMRSLVLYDRIDQGTMQYGLYIADKLSLIGGVYNLTGDNGQALLFLSRALNMTRRLAYTNIKASVLNNLGVLYLEQEDYEKAEYYLGQSLRQYEDSHNRLETARTSMNLAVARLREGELDLALHDLTKAAEEARNLSNTDLMIAAGEGLGAVHLAKRSYQIAYEELDQSLRLARATKDVLRIAELLWLKAAVANRLHRFSEALIFAEEALVVARNLNQPKLLYLVTTALGETYLGLKKADLAEKTLCNAIDQLESIRRGVAGGQQERQLFLGNHITAYHDLVNLFVDQNRAAQGLEYAERAKARVLLDILVGAKMPLALTGQEKEEEEQLNRAIIEVNNDIRGSHSLAASKTPGFDDLVRRRDAARMKYASFHDLMWSSHPELQSIGMAGESLKAEHFKKLVQENHTTFLEYVVTDDRTQLFVLAPSTSGYAVKSYQINIRQEELVKQVEELRRAMADRRADFAVRSRELFNLLVRPAESALSRNTILCIVPDGPLWEVPFHALSASGGHFLLEDHAVYYAPSLSVWNHLSYKKVTKTQPQSLLALGNPFLKSGASEYGESQIPSDYLPEAENEVKMLRRVNGSARSQVVVGTKANEKLFRSFAAQYDILHFATHGVLDNRSPLYSFLVLAREESQPDQDGLLEAREIMDMDLKADLAVLSACETARGKIGAGEGVIGMSWAFFVAGCRTTLVSQWKVNSASTSALMIKFYQYLQAGSGRTRRTKAEALRLASLDLMKDERYRHPFYWAPFVLVGSN